MKWIEDFFIGLSNFLMWAAAELLLSGVLGLIGMAGACLLMIGFLWILSFFYKGKLAKKLPKKHLQENNLNEEEKAEVAKLKKLYPSSGFQKSVDKRYLLGSNYPLRIMFFSWQFLMLVPLMYAYLFLPDLPVPWREFLAKFTIFGSFGAVVLVVVMYWQRQIKQVWMNEDGQLFYKVRQEEKMLRYLDYKYVRVINYNDDYPYKIIFSDYENERSRLWFGGELNFLPQKTIAMPLWSLVDAADRQPVRAKKLTNEIGKSLLKEGFEIKPMLQNNPGGEGWLATRPG